MLASFGSFSMLTEVWPGGDGGQLTHFWQKLTFRHSFNDDEETAGEFSFLYY